MCDPISQRRNWIHVPCLGKQILNHWTTRDVPSYHILTRSKEPERSRGGMLRWRTCQPVSMRIWGHFTSKFQPSLKQIQNLKEKKKKLIFENILSWYQHMPVILLLQKPIYLNKAFWCHSSRSIWSGQQKTSEYWLFVKESSCEQRTKITKTDIGNPGLVGKEFKSFKCHIYIYIHTHIKFYPTFFHLYNNWSLFLIK